MGRVGALVSRGEVGDRPGTRKLGGGPLVYQGLGVGQERLKELFVELGVDAYDSVAIDYDPAEPVEDAAFTDALVHEIQVVTVLPFLTGSDEGAGPRVLVKPIDSGAGDKNEGLEETLGVLFGGERLHPPSRE